jgi:hypothetical protein
VDALEHLVLSDVGQDIDVQELFAETPILSEDPALATVTGLCSAHFSFAKIISVEICFTRKKVVKNRPKLSIL